MGKVDELRAPGRDRCFTIYQIYELTSLQAYELTDVIVLLAPGVLEAIY